MMDFTGVTAIEIPEGAVQKIVNAAGEVLWEKSGGNNVNYIDGITSDGVAYIATDIPAKSTIGFEIEFSMISTSGVIGVIGAFNYGGYNHNFAIYNGQWFTQYGNNEGYMFGSVDTNKHILRQNVVNGVVTFDGETIQTGLTYYDNDRTFNLFCYNGGPSYPTFWIGQSKITACRWYDNGELIREYKACFDPEGVACMYDTVMKEYHYNANASGLFTGG